MGMMGAPQTVRAAQTAFYVLCATLPIHLLCYVPFFRSLRSSWKSSAARVSLGMCLELAALFIAVRHGGDGRRVEFLFAPIYMGIYFYNIRLNPSKLMFTYLFIMDYLMIVKGLAAFFTVRVLSLPVASWQDGLVCLLLYGLSLPLMLRFFCRTAASMFHTDAPALWRTIWLVPALTSGVVLLFTGAFQEETVGNWTFLFARVSLLISVFVVYSILLRSLEGIRRQAALEEQTRQAEQMILLQRSQYAMLKEHMEETRRARHDLRQHLQLIRSYLADGQQQALADYLETYGNSLPSDTGQRYCKNYAVDAIVRHYAERMEAAGIDLECEIRLPEDLVAAEPDVCVLLGNLLENALEACTPLGSKGWVRLCAETAGERGLSIIVDNAAPAPPREQEGVFLSSKHEGLGMGTQSVKAIAARYGGVAEFKWEDGVFYGSVLLNP